LYVRSHPPDLNELPTATLARDLGNRVSHSAVKFGTLRGSSRLEVDVDAAKSEDLQSSFKPAPRDIHCEFGVPPLLKARGNCAVRAAALFSADVGADNGTGPRIVSLMRDARWPFGSGRMA
jgi:hypothetical protein